jgi:hypothetical protein
MDSVVAVAGAAGATRAAADAVAETLAVISPALPPSKRVHTSFSWTFLLYFISTDIIPYEYQSGAVTFPKYNPSLLITYLTVLATFFFDVNSISVK